MIELAILVGIVGALALGWCLISVGNDTADSVTGDSEVLHPAKEVIISLKAQKTIVDVIKKQGGQ